MITDDSFSLRKVQNGQNPDLYTQEILNQTRESNDKIRARMFAVKVAVVSSVIDILTVIPLCFQTFRDQLQSVFGSLEVLKPP